MKDFSVAICTYNGANRIPDVLDALKAQEGTEDLAWEVLVVDNNSDDSTADVVQRYQSVWPEAFTLRYLFEPEQGKTHAIRRAFREAEGELVGFLDDDNIPERDWVAESCAFGRSNPKAGAYGSCIYPEYEEQPPKNARAIEGAFAIVRDPRRYRYPAGGMLGRMFAPGAGLVIRKQAWQECVPEKLSLAGPQGSSSMGLHEDMEVQWYIHRAGWEIWHNPAMCIRHKLPPQRFEEQYLMRFFKELGLSRHQYRMLTYSAWQRPLMVMAYLASDLVKLAQSSYAYHTGSNSDISAKCRIRMRKFLVISPFYHLTAGLLKKVW